MMWIPKDTNGKIGIEVGGLEGEERDVYNWREVVRSKGFREGRTNWKRRKENVE